MSEVGGCTTSGTLKIWEGKVGECSSVASLQRVSTLTDRLPWVERRVNNDADDAEDEKRREGDDHLYSKTKGVAARRRAPRLSARALRPPCLYTGALQSA